MCAAACVPISSGTSRNGRRSTRNRIARRSMTGNKKRGGLIVQPRDRRLFEELAVMRIVDREQAKLVAGFGSTTRANSRLLALTRSGLLRRFFLGSRKSLYS